LPRNAAATRYRVRECSMRPARRYARKNGPTACGRAVAPEPGALFLAGRSRWGGCARPAASECRRKEPPAPPLDCADAGGGGTDWTRKAQRRRRVGVRRAKPRTRRRFGRAACAAPAHGRCRLGKRGPVEGRKSPRSRTGGLVCASPPQPQARAGEISCALAEHDDREKGAASRCCQHCFVVLPPAIPGRGRGCAGSWGPRSSLP
jgi:hypothetical protein